MSQRQDEHPERAHALMMKALDDELSSVERAELERILAPRAMVGRAPEQVDRFIAERVGPVLDKYEDEIDAAGPTLSV